MIRDAPALGNMPGCMNAVSDDQAGSAAGSIANGHSFWDLHPQAVLHCHPSCWGAMSAIPCKPTLLSTNDAFSVGEEHTHGRFLFLRRHGYFISHTLPQNTPFHHGPPAVGGYVHAGVMATAR